MSDKPMTLAEAIKLGATHMKPKAGDFHYDNWTSGCAIGMAMFAHGKISIAKLSQLHPVLNSSIAIKTGHPHSWPFAAHITNEFDEVVMRKRRPNRQKAFDKLLDEIAIHEREFEAAANAAKAATATAPAETTTKAAASPTQAKKISRKTVTTPVKPHA